MNTSKLIGKVLLTFFSGTIIFVGYLYYLGATIPVEPIEEVLVDGQWVRYRDYSDEYPGDIKLLDDNLYSDGSSVFIAGEARSGWFSESKMPAELIASDGTLLWNGTVATDENYVYDMIVPFYADAEINDYRGDATFVMYTVDYTEENPDEPMKKYSYSASVVIADGNDYEEIEEDVEIGD